MSTDLQFRQDLHQLRLPSIRITPLHAKKSSEAGAETSKPDEFTAGEDECSTPTSAEHRIPVVLSCPPAPKKQRVLTAPCKRKLGREFEFYKIVPAEELEEFFKKTEFEVIERNSKRKRSL